MGDAAVGLITMHHYNVDLDNAENKAFVAAWNKEYGANLYAPTSSPSAGYDGMAAIAHATVALKGKLDGDQAVASLKGWKFNSPARADHGRPRDPRHCHERILGRGGEGRRRQAAPEAARHPQ
jgi:ABC-type branched-subunit amino acid transport system substrate-binding protein